MATGDGSNYSLTTNIGLFKPTVGVCGALGVEPAGKSWMELQNSSFDLLDAHTHAPGFGAQVPSAGLNINTALPFNSNDATGLRSTRFTAITLGSLTASDIGCLIVSGADLYYVDTAGNQVRLTSAGGVAGSPGSISGLVSPAAASYTPGSKLFSFTSSSGFVANMSCGPIAIGDASTSGGKAATIKVPSALAANYQITLPSALPGAQKILSIDSTGQMFAAYDVDGSTLQVAANAIGVKAGGLTTTHLSASAGILGSQLSASAGITGGQIASATITRGNLAAVGQQVSASSGTFSTNSTPYVSVTNLTATLTTTGRPVIVAIQPDGSTSFPLSIGAAAGGFSIKLLRGATVVAFWQFANTTGFGVGLPNFTFIDAVGAGTYTYTVQMSSGGGGTNSFAQAVLVAYEL